MMRAAWDIAHIVERASAAERVRIRGRTRGQSMKDAVAREYDPLAATCLAELIESRMTPALPDTQPETPSRHGGRP